MSASRPWSFYARLEALRANGDILGPDMHEPRAEETPSNAALDRLEFETLLSDVSALLIAADPEGLEPAIESALHRVLAFFRADRCGLLGVTGDRPVVNVLYGAYAEGLSGLPGEIDLVALFPWAARALLTERAPVIVRRMADLPPEAAVDRASWDQHVPTLSNLAVPILAGGAVTHMLVIHWVHTECDFPDAYVPRLRLLGEMMTNALHRKRAFDDLRTSEERLERAATAADCGLWEIDIPSGRIWVAAGTRRLYGLTAVESPDWNRFVNLVHPEERDAVASRVDAVMRGDGIFDQEYRIVRDDGAVRWMRARGRADGPARLLGVSVDVTDRVEAEWRAAEHAERVIAAADTAGLGFSDWKVGGGGPPYIDARLRDLFDLTDEDDANLQDTWLSRIHPDDLTDVAEQRRQLIAGGIDHLAVEYRYRHRVRGWTWLRHVSRRLRDTRAGSDHVRLVGAVQDITRQRDREAELQAALNEVRQLRDRLEQENLYLRRETQRGRGAGPIVDRSPAIRGTLALADQVAQTNSTVLLVGETGTGKERLATYIHEASPRRAHTMVRVNCSAIPSALIESELFGREKGAYTGALSRQIGRFELAHGSTLFLDEVGDLPLDVQVKLLRVLQERSIERLGSPRPIAVDVRIIAATNRSLEQAVRDGTFRSDLYYRLNVFPIVVPPLRDRRGDIPALIGQLVEELGAAIAKPVDSVAKASVDALMRYDWPGNVRELRNVLERALILADGPVLTVDLPDSAGPSPAVRPDEAAGELQDVERQHIFRVLAQTGWRIRGRHAAADVLGLKPTTLEARMKRLGIRRPKTGGDS
jgi:PAS domain S-box-containing protein